jgi:hypothetical protein
VKARVQGCSYGKGVAQSKLWYNAGRGKDWTHATYDLQPTRNPAAQTSPKKSEHIHPHTDRQEHNLLHNGVCHQPESSAGHHCPERELSAVDCVHKGSLNNRLPGNGTAAGTHDWLLDETLPPLEGGLRCASVAGGCSMRGRGCAEPQCIHVLRGPQVPLSQ